MSIDVPNEERTSADAGPGPTVGALPGILADFYDSVVSDDSAAAGLPVLPFPFPPFLVRRSGVYRLSRPIVFPTVPVPIPIPRIPPIDLPTGDGPGTSTSSATPETQFEPSQDEGTADILPLPLFGTEELRVDVDGVKPTMTVSGTITRLFRGGRLTWIARVAKDPTTGAWTGPISYRDGNSALRPHTTVSVRLTGGPLLPINRRATATFSGGASAALTLTYDFTRSAFREVAFEYDTVSDATAVTSHNPTTHPNHSPAAPTSFLTLESAYARLGIGVTRGSTLSTL